MGTTVLVMWLTLLLPPLLLPALVGFSRFETRMLSGPTPVRVERAASVVPSPH